MTVISLPDLTTPRARVAAEVRGQLARKKVAVSRLEELLGNSREYWRRRIVVGDVALDVDDLQKLADLLSIEVVEFYGVRGSSGPEGPGGPGVHPPGLEPGTH
jgi:hypothetical protein